MSSEVALERLAVDVSPATAKLSLCSIELISKLVRQLCGDLNHRAPDEVIEKSMTSS
jgi:hypothetical protein